MLHPFGGTSSRADTADGGGGPNSSLVTGTCEQANAMGVVTDTWADTADGSGASATGAGNSGGSGSRRGCLRAL